MSERRSTAQGVPPWDTAPTPTLPVFRAALNRDPGLLGVLKPGHLRNLVPMMLARIDELESELLANADLLEQSAQVITELESRRATKREYQRDYRAGLRGNRAARAALRRGAGS